MNTHDLCVWNLEVEQHQFKVLFHIYDLILSHLYPHMVTSYIKRLDKLCLRTDPLTVIRGKLCEYLGMSIDFTLKTSVAIT